MHEPIPLRSEMADDDAWGKILVGLFERAHGPGRIMIVGIGQRFRHDDYLGSLIAKDLQALETHPRNRAVIIDAEGSLENLRWSEIDHRASLLVIIDAVDMGLRPGSIRLVDVNDTTYPFFTTHNLPLKLVLGSSGLDKRPVVILGVQPGNVEFGESLSKDVETARVSIVTEVHRLIQTLGEEG